MKRCSWCNLKNDIYIKYHDEEWGVPNFCDHYLFEMLILESFQAGLSWECVLNKREAFRSAYDNFDIDKVIRKVSMLKNVTHRLSISRVNNITIIDDSYNSNFEGFINALDVLKSFDGIKVIISPGIVEGSNIDEIKIANKIKDCCDEILLINNPSISKYIENKQSFLSFKQAYDYIRKKYQEDKITLLIENDIPDIYLR